MQSRVSLFLYVVALVGFAAAIVVGLVGSSVVAAVLSCATFVVASTAFLVRRIDTMENRVLTIDPALAQFAAKVDANSVEGELLRKAAALYHERLSEIAHGRVPIANKAELFAAMRAIAGAATRSIHSVDQIPLEDWESQQLKELLGVQKRARKRGVDTIRIRIVDDARLADKEYGTKLAAYVAAQRDADIDIRLCRRSRLDHERLRSIQPGGWMLIDRGDPARTKGTYSTVAGGAVTEGAIFLHETPETRRRAEEFETLLEASAGELEAVVAQHAAGDVLTEALAGSLQKAKSRRRKAAADGRPPA